MRANRNFERKNYRVTRYFAMPSAIELAQVAWYQEVEQRIRSRELLMNPHSTKTAGHLEFIKTE